MLSDLLFWTTLLFCILKNKLHWFISSLGQMGKKKNNYFCLLKLGYAVIYAIYWRGGREVRIHYNHVNASFVVSTASSAGATKTKHICFLEHHYNGIGIFKKSVSLLVNIYFND